VRQNAISIKYIENPSEAASSTSISKER